MDLEKLTAPERALRDAFTGGELVDLARARSLRARTVRAEFVAALLLGAVPPEPGQVAAVRLNGARVTGTLNLAHATVTVPLQLRRCEFDNAIELAGVKSRDIDLHGSRLAGISAALAEVDGNLSFGECECAGPVLLTGARVLGALRMQRTRLDCPDRVALLGNRLAVDGDLLAQEVTVDGEFRLAGARVGGIVGLDGATLRHEGGRALNGFKLTVGAAFLARDGFSAAGELALTDAVIEREVDLRGAALSNPGGNALAAIGLRAGTYLWCAEGFTAHGMIRLSRATFGAEIHLSGIRVSNPGGDAIRCRYTQATTFILDAGSSVDGAVDLRYSRFTDIRDSPGCWPDQLRLTGLSYDALEPAHPVRQRIDWLRRDTGGYLPQNYETLSAMYRRLGDDAGARAVLLARERERRAHLPWYSRAWSWLQEVTVGYGYRPLRATGWLAVFLLAGALVFGLHHPPPLPGTPHPAFNSFIYTVDLLVPLISLGLRSSYDPQGAERWLAYLLIALGWIFVTTIAAGVLRVLRRQ